jgi:hypothetical protein
MSTFAAIAATGAAVLITGAFVIGVDYGTKRANAAHDREEQVAQTARDAAIEGAAQEIAKIKLTHTTIRQQATKEIIREKVYVECMHTPAVRSLLDDALANRAKAEPAAGGLVPGKAASAP